MKASIIASLLVFAAGSAFAQEDKIAVLDADTDGRISVEEAANDPSLSAVFSELDVNKDGYLTPSELADH